LSSDLLLSLRWNWRRDFGARRGSIWAGIAVELQYFASGRFADLQDGLRGVSIMRANVVQFASDHGEDQSSDLAFKRRKDRNHGMHRERAWRNGGRRFWLRGRCAWQGQS